MAQSRPPPLRSTNSAVVVSPPPVSPRTLSEKRHHVRRKSGKEVIVTEKKTVGRPAPLTRRTTPQYLAKTSNGHGKLKHSREDDESRRDSGESFPQFCMTCEKQFVPANNTFLYCSETCRVHDTNIHAPGRSNSTSSISPTTPYFYSPNEGPDIIPRASPTQSRPRSYFNSDPFVHSYSYQGASTYHDPTPSASVYDGSRSSTALASLRELATALPRTSPPQSHDRDSPPISRTGSGVWNYISVPFGKPAATTPNITPQNSLNEKKYTASTSYGGYSASGNRSREDLPAYGAAKSYGGAGGYAPATGGMGMDRPLPPRSGPGVYGHRPKSIDLVTPYATGQ